jgi:hypothetical protein
VALELVSWLGVLLSLLLAFSTVTTFLLPLALWTLYLSLVNLGGMIMNYGWEWLTLELGFLAIFLCPAWSLSPFPHSVPPPRLVLWLFRWSAFRYYTHYTLCPLYSVLTRWSAFRLLIG